MLVVLQVPAQPVEQRRPIARFGGDPSRICGRRVSSSGAVATTSAPSNTPPPNCSRIQRVRSCTVVLTPPAGAEASASVTSPRAQTPSRVR